MTAMECARVASCIMNMWLYILLPLQNSVNHKEQQIASLVWQISMVQNSLSDTNDLVSSISKVT